MIFLGKFSFCQCWPFSFFFFFAFCPLYFFDFFKFFYLVIFVSCFESPGILCVFMLVYLKFHKTNIFTLRHNLNLIHHFTIFSTCVCMGRKEVGLSKKGPIQIWLFGSPGQKDHINSRPPVCSFVTHFSLKWFISFFLLEIHKRSKVRAGFFGKI